MIEHTASPKAEGNSHSIKTYLTDLIDLTKGVDKQATVTEIKSKDMMTGANAWMLMSSIIIASIGLNLNSPAVIIGAMLISPLMSPILSLGLAVATNDKKTLQRSLRHLGIAVVIALVASTIYFYLSPFNELNSQIEKRLEPTALDVLIAFFGGVAGIISYVRKDISTAIPGVAIATALMPPLCVTGYSISNGQWNMALSSFYLFFLNTFFVTLATFLIIRYLKFPYKTYVNSRDRRRNILYITLFSLVVIIPSLFLFQKVLSETQQRIAVKSFVKEYIDKDQIYLDDYQWIESDSINTLILKVYGDKISEDSMTTYQEGLKKYNLNNTRIEIIPTSEIRLERLVTLESKLKGVENISKQLEATKTEKEKQNELIAYLHKKIQSNSIDSAQFLAVRNELKILFPEIIELTLGTVKQSDFNSFTDKLPILLIEWPTRYKNQRALHQKEEKIRSFIRTRIKLDTLRYYHTFQ